MTGRVYTADDMAMLRTLAARGLTQAQIADAMDRSVGSVAGVLSTHGICTHGTPGRMPRKRAADSWSPEAIAIVRRMAEGRHTSYEIAQVTGRTRRAVRQICYRTGIRLLASSFSPKIVDNTHWPRPVDSWPAHIRFEDDPRACRPEPPFKSTPIVNFSAMGCTAAMCAGMGSQRMGGRW